MRDLSPTLLAAQQAMTIDALAKIHLTDGVDIYTYTRDRILDISYPQEPWSQTAKVLLENGDGALTDINLKGFYGFISMGAITSAGEEYSDGSLLWVIAQRFDSSPGKLTCELSLIGIPNLLLEDKASKNYIPDENNDESVKTLINAILGATLCYSHCKAYEVEWETGYDSLADTYKPRDGFRIYLNQPRLAVIQKLLDCTRNVMIAKADGRLHFFLPQITGTPVYTYELESGHTFWSKAYRKTLVIPNYIYASSPPPTVPNWVVVTSTPYSGEAKDQTDINKFGNRKHTSDYGAETYESDAECAEQAQFELDRYIALHDPYYEGTATDPDSIAAIGEIRAYHQHTFEDDAQAQQVAEAILAKLKLNAEMGGASVPINVAQEVYDFILVKDIRQGDERTGTIGSLTLHYNADEAEWRMSFSFGQRPAPAVDIMPIVEQAAAYFGQLTVDKLYARKILADQLDMYWLDPDNTIDLSKIGDNIDNLQDGDQYARVKSLHLDAGLIKLDDNVLYTEGFDPTTKEKGISKGPGPPSNPSAGDLWIDTSPLLPLPNIWKRWTGSAWVKATPEDLDEIGNGLVYGRALSSSLTAEGLVVLDELYVDDTGGNYALVNRTSIQAGKILLDQVETTGQDYGLIKSTDIDSGHILLQTTIDGGGYKKYTTTEASKLLGIEEGAEKTTGKSLSILTDRTLGFIADVPTRKAVDANEKIGAGEAYDVFMSKLTAYGLNIWSAYSSTRVELTQNGLRGYSGGVLQAEIRATDGKIYAGAGAVVLDAYGIKIKGEYLVLASPAGSYPARISVEGSGDLLLNPTYDIACGGSVKPAFSQAYDLGKSNLLWRNVYAQIFRPESSTSGGIILPSVAKAEEGSVKIKAGEAGIYVYRSGAWEHIT